MNPPEQRIRVGTWIRMEIPGQGTFTGFTYVDAQAGFSAKGWMSDETAGVPSVTVRLPFGVPWEELSADQIAEQKLDNPPSWVAEFYGPQPTVGTEWGWWRDHPKLKGRFLPDYPDDLQVLVHDGGPRLTAIRPELMWVRVTGGNGEIFTGRLLNQPHQLKTAKLGDEIHFFLPDSLEHPLRVTEKYLAERPNWTIMPCNKCGLSELFDAPSDLIRVIFPNQPGEMVGFTSFCGSCGGVQVVRATGANAAVYTAALPRTTEPAAPAKKSWWQFWK